MARSAESVERWRAKAAERRRREQRQAQGVERWREQRRDEISRRLAAREQALMAEFRIRREDGETGP